VATPVDNDSIATAEQQALATMQAHPQLRGWVVADAGGGIGVGQVIQALIQRRVPGNGRERSAAEPGAKLGNGAADGPGG
jgi:ABC-type sugar transport system substrate-binding protein